MCMWQSAALAGALTLAGSVPVVFGTACWAWLTAPSTAPAAAAAAAAVKKLRRPMAWLLAWLVIGVPPVVRHLVHFVPNRNCPDPSASRPLFGGISISSPLRK